MRERFKQWLPKIKINKWWLIGVAVTPIFVGMGGWFWLLPERSPQPDYGHLSHDEKETLAHQHRETLISGIGMIALVAGGVFLSLRFCTANRNVETADFSGADLSGVNFSGADLSGANLSGANLSGANLSGVDFSGADLISTNLSGADLSGAKLRYANLSGAELRYANLSGAELKYTNLSDADLNGTLLRYANLSDANLSGALLFFVNLRGVLNLEPFQIEAEPSPFLCNVALPAYAKQPDINPNRACDLVPQLLSDRYDIPLEEAQEIVDEARRHQWN